MRATPPPTGYFDVGGIFTDLFILFICSHQPGQSARAVPGAGSHDVARDRRPGRLCRACCPVVSHNFSHYSHAAYPSVVCLLKFVLGSPVRAFTSCTYLAGPIFYSPTSTSATAPSPWYGGCTSPIDTRWSANAHSMTDVRSCAVPPALPHRTGPQDHGLGVNGHSSLVTERSCTLC